MQIVNTTSTSTAQDCLILSSDESDIEKFPASAGRDDDDMVETGFNDIKSWKSFNLDMYRWPKTRYVTHVERKHSNDICRPGGFYELRDGCFILVQSIRKDEQHKYLLVGHVFTRAEVVGPEVPSRRNAMHWPVDQRRDTTTNTQMPHIYYNELIWQVRVAYKEDKQDYGL